MEYGMAKRDTMFAMIERWQRSGKSKAAFARDAGVSINTFHYWCRRFDEEGSDLSTSPFIEVTNGAVGEVSLDEPRLRVEYPDGVIISIY